MTTTTTKIAELNDQCRKSLFHPTLHLSVGIFNKNTTKINAILELIKKFDSFTEENDPYGEHDFGSIEYKGEKIFWKIDYYDVNHKYLSEDPADPAKTKRVITVMLATEY